MYILEIFLQSHKFNIFNISCVFRSMLFHTICVLHNVIFTTYHSKYSVHIRYSVQICAIFLLLIIVSHVILRKQAKKLQDTSQLIIVCVFTT